MCDEPHPLLVQNMIDHCLKSDLSAAHKILKHLWDLGYSAEDIFSMLFRIVKNHQMDEYLKLEYIKVCVPIRWAVELLPRTSFLHPTSHGTRYM